MSRPAHLLLLLTAAAWWSAPSPANVFAADGSDPRRYVARDDPAWRLLQPVGTVAAEFALLDRRGYGNVAPGMGTAFLVSPCYAMTSYHVLFGGGTNTLDPMADYTATLRFGLEQEGPPALLVRGHVRYWGSTGTASPDVALIRLDRCVGLQLGWYDLAAAPDDHSAPVTMPSVSRDRSLRRVSVQERCHVRDRLPRRGWLLHDCATRDGASGAPLIVERVGVPAVIGVNAGEFGAVAGIRRGYDPPHANWAVAASWILRSRRLQAMLDRDRARAPHANPLDPAGA